MNATAVALVFACLGVVTPGVRADALRPRTEFTKATTLAPPTTPHRLVVKFRDPLKTRCTPQGVRSLVDADLREVAAVEKRFDARFRPLLGLDDDHLAWMEDRAAARSGRSQPDLAGFMVVDAPEHRLPRIACVLNDMDCTEIVYFQEIAPPPPCGDTLPITPIYHNNQGFLGRAPGLDATSIWALGSGRGAGIKLADCEYGFNAAHEDLCNVTVEPDQTISPAVFANGWDDHGTAVMGVVGSLDNEYGCRGLVTDADLLFFTEWSVEQGFRRTASIAAAIASVDAGDVIMLLMQASGPGGGYGPAELDAAVWTLVRNATDAGIIVVAAAGNGNQNLDSTAYAEYMSRGDSGAIIVGAGSANTSHSKLSFSTYGTRVNLQGWGQSVFTLGYGSHAEWGNDADQRYTSSFNGTSSATPMVAGVCVALQSLAEEQLGSRLTPEQMRNALVWTGIPQSGAQSGNIGPFPDAVAAATWLGIGQLSGDANGDGVVDVRDLIVVILGWGGCPIAPLPCPGDVDGNGTVDVTDLTMVILNWTG